MADHDPERPSGSARGVQQCPRCGLEYEVDRSHELLHRADSARHNAAEIVLTAASLRQELRILAGEARERPRD